MTSYRFLIGSSVGKKILMAISGLCMIGFLVVHLLGNSLAFVGADAFNGYAKKLHSLGPLLILFNCGLLMIGLVHIVVGVMLFIENIKARPTRYKVVKNPGGRTIGSDSMPYTGLFILLFVLVHLLKFTFTDKTVTPIYQLMSTVFSNPLWVTVYVVAMIVVALHISHGFWSLFQTLGVDHSYLMPVIRKLGVVLTVAFGVGFGILPIYLFMIT